MIFNTLQMRKSLTLLLLLLSACYQPDNQTPLPSIGTSTLPQEVAEQETLAPTQTKGASLLIEQNRCFAQSNSSFPLPQKEMVVAIPEDGYEFKRGWRIDINSGMKIAPLIGPINPYYQSWDYRVGQHVSPNHDFWVSFVANEEKKEVQVAVYNSQTQLVDYYPLEGSRDNYPFLGGNRPINWWWSSNNEIIIFNEDVILLNPQTLEIKQHSITPIGDIEGMVIPSTYYVAEGDRYPRGFHLNNPNHTHILYTADVDGEPPFELILFDRVKMRERLRLYNFVGSSDVKPIWHQATEQFLFFSEQKMLGINLEGEMKTIFTLDKKDTRSLGPIQDFTVSETGRFFFLTFEMEDSSSYLADVETGYAERICEGEDRYIWGGWFLSDDFLLYLTHESTVPSARKTNDQFKLIHLGERKVRVVWEAKEIEAFDFGGWLNPPP